jgi:hypothetical protein
MSSSDQPPEDARRGQTGRAETQRLAEQLADQAVSTARDQVRRSVDELRVTARDAYAKDSRRDDGENIGSVFETLAEGLRQQAELTNKPFTVIRYQLFSTEAANAYADISPLWRLRLASASDLAAQAVCVCGFVIWWLALSRMQFANLSLISPAVAATETSPVFDPKPYVYVGIFVALAVAFFMSLFVQYFGKSPKVQDSAGTMTKLLAGFFVGAATKYLGA